MKDRILASAYVAFFLVELQGEPWQSLRAGVKRASELLGLPIEGRRSEVAIRCMNKLVSLGLHPPERYVPPWKDKNRTGYTLAHKPSRAREFYNSWEWRELRYKILKRYGRKCMCCGAGPHDTTIMVDHIIPIRKRWDLRLDPENLQVLCDDCNMGKSYRDTTDFRPEAST